MPKNAILWDILLTNLSFSSINTLCCYLLISKEDVVFMNKTELVAAMAEKAELSKKDAEKALKAFTETVAEELKKGEKIQLVGFGTFETSQRAARTGKNPQTGKAIKIPASTAPKFKAGKGLKDTVNAGKKKK